jgi:hypothetical protein
MILWRLDTNAKFSRSLVAGEDSTSLSHPPSGVITSACAHNSRRITG